MSSRMELPLSSTWPTRLWPGQSFGHTAGRNHRADYYSRLEQGRLTGASANVLDAIAAALFIGFGQVPQHDRNFIRLLFLDSEVRGRYADWLSIAPTCVAFLFRRPAGFTH